MRLLVLIGCVMAVGCGGKGKTEESKGLFSLWKDTTTGNQLDLRGGSYGSNPMSFYFLNGARCNCIGTITQSPHNYSLVSCTYVVGSAGGDPGCAALDQDGWYTLRSASLTFYPNDTVNRTEATYY